MINKKILYLYTGKFCKNTQKLRGRLKSRGEISGIIIRGFGDFFYFISERKYEQGTPLFKEDKLGNENRPILFGTLKESGIKIKVADYISYGYIHHFSFFIENYGSRSARKIPKHIIHKIVERKDYEQIYN